MTKKMSNKGLSYADAIIGGYYVLSKVKKRYKKATVYWLYNLHFGLKQLTSDEYKAVLKEGKVTIKQAEEIFQSGGV